MITKCLASVDYLPPLPPPPHTLVKEVCQEVVSVMSITWQLADNLGMSDLHKGIESIPDHL